MPLNKEANPNQTMNLFFNLVSDHLRSRVTGCYLSYPCLTKQCHVNINFYKEKKRYRMSAEGISSGLGLVSLASRKLFMSYILSLNGK